MLGGMNDSSPRWHPPAVLSLLFGLASLVLLALTGIPALILGLRGLRAIHAADGRLRGARLAMAGMTLGGVGTLLTLLGFVALILVGVQSTSRRLDCMNRLRQIGLAVQKHADVHGAFPAATRTPAALLPSQRHSWLADVLPLLAEGTKTHAVYEELAARIDREHAWDAPANASAAAEAVGMFLCPSHGGADLRRPPGKTSYVGISGLGADAADLPREHPRAGVFGHDRGVRRAEVRGGISTTLLALETGHDNGPWLAGGWPTVRGLAAEENRYFGPGHSFGGLHGGVVQVLWVDGSVRPLTDDTSAIVVRSAATLAYDGK